jgi:hypothetical protein
MNLSVGAPPCELLLISEAHIQKIGERLTEGALAADEFYSMIDSQKVDVYRCPKCDRVHIDQGGGLFDAYRREVDIRNEEVGGAE